MHDETGRLVDDEERLVLVGHPQRDRFRLERLVRRSGELDAHLLATSQPVARPAALAVHHGAAVADESLSVGAADASDGGNGEVDASARSRALDEAIGHRGHAAGSSRRSRPSKKVR
jgi:hypothetical protein